jgi:imidazoleglycerol phosphate synthase glutamine amidotransferase subunit HisH
MLDNRVVHSRRRTIRRIVAVPHELGMVAQVLNPAVNEFCNTLAGALVAFEPAQRVPHMGWNVCFRVSPERLAVPLPQSGAR